MEMGAQALLCWFLIRQPADLYLPLLENSFRITLHSFALPSETLEIFAQVPLMENLKGVGFARIFAVSPSADKVRAVASMEFGFRLIEPERLRRLLARLRP